MGPNSDFQKPGWQAARSQAELAWTNTPAGGWSQHGDIDGDGGMDIIAGNWGLNSAYRATPEQPLKLYYGDWRARTVDIIETEYDPVSKAVRRGAVSPPCRSLSRFCVNGSHASAFSEATISSVLGEQQTRVRETQINTLASMIFFNRGNRFEAVALPREAQLAPVFSVNVETLMAMSRGHFLERNFFANQPRRRAWTPASVCGWKATEQEVEACRHESGVKVFGEQRGARWPTSMKMGVLTGRDTNGTATRLFQNVTPNQGCACA